MVEPVSVSNVYFVRANRRSKTESFYSGEDVPVFLLNVFAKNEKTDLSQACRRAFKNVEI